MKLLLMLLTLFSVTAWAMDSPQQELPSTWLEGAYVQNSEPLLNPKAQASELKAMQEKGITHLYINLTPAQLANKTVTHPQLAELIRNAWMRKITISPMLKAANHSLTNYADLPFYSLYVDPDFTQDDSVESWIAVAKQARALTSIPIEITSPALWFTSESKTTVCVKCALKDLDINNVTLKTFTKNTDRISDIMHDASERYPEISFRTQQHVGIDIGDVDHWADSKSDKADVQKLRQQLSSQRTVGIDWHSWEEFKETGLDLRAE